MNWPTVSVVIPSLNQAVTIERTILSILQQHYPGHVEMIVVDRGSADATVEILKHYPKLIVQTIVDRGLADAINHGLAVATGDIIAMQSADSFYLRDSFRAAIAPFQSDLDLAITSGCDVILQSDGTCICSPLDDYEISPRSLLMRRIIEPTCAFFRRELLDRIGGLRTHMSEAAQLDFWYRALHLYRGQFVPRHVTASEVHPILHRTSSRWYQSLVMMVESCEADKTLGRIFKLSTSDKRDLYARWEILEEHRAGNTASSIELIDRLMESPECSEETIWFLQTNGLIPRTGMAASRMRSVVPRVPDFDWYQQDSRAVA